jgi:type I restriction enzyme S subunit
MPRADWKQVSQLSIPLPPLPEQREIARILGALDDKIELNRRMNATLEAMARALFQSWFVDFDPVRAKAEGRQPVGMDAETAALFPDSFEDSPLGPIPTGWAVWTLGQLCEFEYGKPLKAEDRKGGTIPVYGAGGQVGWHDKPLVSGPGVIVGRKGNPGVVTWSQSDFYPIDTAFYVKAKDSSMSAYMLFQILSGLDLSRLSVDSGVPGLNRHHAYMSPLVVAPRRILQAFDAHARTLGVELANKINSSRSLSEMRELLLPRLLSGELRVGDIAA